MKNLEIERLILKAGFGMDFKMEKKPRNPLPTVDVIIEIERRGIVLIRRKNPPFGWALPGGFVELGESAESAAVREAQEECGLEVVLLEQFHTYSDPARDPRRHTLSIVYIAEAGGIPVGADDAVEACIFDPVALPSPMAFDHARIIRDYLAYKERGERGRFTLQIQE